MITIVSIILYAVAAFCAVMMGVAAEKYYGKQRTENEKTASLLVFGAFIVAFACAVALQVAA